MICSSPAACWWKLVYTQKAIDPSFSVVWHVTTHFPTMMCKILTIPFKSNCLRQSYQITYPEVQCRERLIIQYVVEDIANYFNPVDEGRHLTVTVTYVARILWRKCWHFMAFKVPSQTNLMKLPRYTFKIGLILNHVLPKHWLVRQDTSASWT